MMKTGPLKYIHKSFFFVLLQALLFIACNGGGGESPVDDFLSIDLGGAGPGGIGNSALSLDPAAHNFGDVGTGGSGTHSFTLTNTSTQVVFIDSFQGLGSDFSMSNSTCSLSPSGFGPGASCDFDIDFTPSTGGDFSLNVNTRYSASSGGADLVTSFSLIGSAGANAPTNYALTAVTSTTASISWSDLSSNETNFELQRCDGLGCASSFVSAFTDTVLQNETSYTFSGLTEGSYYRYRVRAISPSSQSDWLEGPTMVVFGGITSVDDNGTGVTDLSGLDCREEGQGSYVKVTWGAVADASAYLLYDVSSGSNTLIKTIAAPLTSTLITGLTINTPYKFIVRVATSTGFTSENIVESSLTTTDYLPCSVLGKAAPSHQTTSTSFFYPTDVMIYGTKFFAADRDNHRILIWNNLPTSNADKPDVVLGQSNFTERYYRNTPGAIHTVSSQSLYQPYGVWAGSVGGSEKLVVADYGNHRVLIWNSIPTTNHQAADIVIGQSSFNSNAGDGGDLTRGLQNPISVWSDGTKLYVADYSNHRALIWNTFPTSNFAKPDVYLGQASDTGQGFGCGAGEMRNPSGIWSDGTTLLVPTLLCNRVAVYSPVPTTGNPNPTTILGGTSLTDATADRTAIQSNRPHKAKIAGGKVYVADYNNHRIKVWNSLPAPGAHGTPSDYVIGNSNTGNGSGLTQAGLQNPISMAVSGNRVYVADYNNFRLVGFNTLPTGDGTNADFVIGQEDFVSEVFNDHNPISASTFDYPEGLAYDGTQFFAADVSRNRILVWNNVPTSWNQPADFVIGQGNFSTRTGARSQSQLNAPRGICSAGGKLWVPDHNNRRVMVFDLPITTNSPNASGVLGQTSWTANTVGTEKFRVNQAMRCFYDGTKFYVVDRTYDRVLIWNTLPVMTSVSDNPPADVRIGTDTGNQITQNQFFDPHGVYSDGSKLYVADSNNHRVMVFDPIPTSDDVNASFHLGGNANWVTRTAPASGTGLNYPVDITGDGTGGIYVLDRGNGRIMKFNNPNMTNETADKMYGKDSFVAATEAYNNSISLSSDTRGLLLIDNRLFFGDVQHSKIMGFPVAP